MRGGAQQCELDAGHGGREVGECRGGRMLRSPVAAGGRSEGGGAKRRFMDGVGKDMKLVAVRKKKTKGGRKQTKADDWLGPPLQGTAGRKKNEICSSALMCGTDSHICSQSSVKM